MKRVKLTPSLLKSIIEEEVSKFGEMEDVEDRAKETEEVDADEQADALEKHIDMSKALKIEEARLTKRLTKVREARKRLAKKIVESV